MTSAVTVVATSELLASVRNGSRRAAGCSSAMTPAMNGSPRARGPHDSAGAAAMRWNPFFRQSQPVTPSELPSAGQLNRRYSHVDSL